MGNTRRHLPDLVGRGWCGGHHLFCSHAFWQPAKRVESICAGRNLFWPVFAAVLFPFSHFRVNYVDIVSFRYFLLWNPFIKMRGGAVFSRQLSCSVFCCPGWPPPRQQLLRIHATTWVPQRRPRLGGNGWGLVGLEVVVELEMGASRSDDCQVTQIN